MQISSILEAQVNAAMKTVRPFLSKEQFEVMSDACWGEEKEFFQQTFIELAQLIDTMPETYEQDVKGDRAIAYLHYFSGANDWYITEKDIEGGVTQAFGYAVVNGVQYPYSKFCYVSITEITRCGTDLDLHFTPCPLAEIKHLLAS